MQEFEIKKIYYADFTRVILTKWNGKGKCIIPEGVTYISKDVFRENKNPTEVVFPSTLKKVLPYFGGCPKLKKVIFKEGVEEIDDECFADSNVSEVQFPSSLRKIGKKCFVNCHNLKRVIFPENLREIGERAFDRSGLKEVTFSPKLFDEDFKVDPNDELVIGWWAFYETNLKELICPPNVRLSNTFSGGAAYNFKLTIYSSTFLKLLREIKQQDEKSPWPWHLDFPKVDVIYIEGFDHHLKWCITPIKKQKGYSLINQIKYRFVGWPQKYKGFLARRLQGKVECEFIDSLEKPVEEKGKNDRIKQLLEAIKQKLICVTPELADPIKKEVKQLLNQYDKDLEAFKPELGNSNLSQMSLIGDPETLQNVLVARLESLLGNIDGSLSISPKINEYDKILTSSDYSNVTEITGQASKLKRIKFMLHELNAKCPLSIGDVTQEFLTMIAEVREKALSKILVDGDLNIKEVEEALDRKIDEIYRTLCLTYEFAMSFFKGEMKEDLGSVETIIGNFEESDQKSFLDELGKIKEKYRQLCNQLKIDENSERSFRLDLDRLLHRIKDYVANVFYTKYILKNSISKQKDDEVTSKGAIGETIEEIRNLLNDEHISKESRSELESELEQCIKAGIEKLRPKDNEKIDELYTLDIMYEILKDLYDIKLKIETYLNDIGHYEEAKINVNL